MHTVERVQAEVKHADAMLKLEAGDRSDAEAFWPTWPTLATPTFFALDFEIVLDCLETRAGRKILSEAGLGKAVQDAFGLSHQRAGRWLIYFRNELVRIVDKLDRSMGPESVLKLEKLYSTWAGFFPA